MLPTAMGFSHQLLTEILQPGDLAVDATMGNGHDTQLLAQLVGATGHVYAFDVQEMAVKATKARLTAAQLLAQTTLIHDGHQHVLDYLPPAVPIKGAIFNLGYLPKSDKRIITLPATTQQALAGLCSRLASKGRIVIVAYYGHPGGAAELAALQSYCQALPQASYNVLTYQFINQQNQPPILFCIEKK